MVTPKPMGVFMADVPRAEKLKDRLRRPEIKPSRSTLRLPQQLKKSNGNVNSVRKQSIWRNKCSPIKRNASQLTQQFLNSIDSLKWMRQTVSMITGELTPAAPSMLAVIIQGPPHISCVGLLPVGESLLQPRNKRDTARFV